MYDKTEWKDRLVEYPRRIRLKRSDGSTEIVDYEPIPGVIEEVGTPVNAQNMNKIEDTLESHLSAEMPHVIYNKSDGKKYRYGEIIDERGRPQIIYEEVV